jgi:hypothetical protein
LNNTSFRLTPLTPFKASPTATRAQFREGTTAHHSISPTLRSQAAEDEDENEGTTSVWHRQIYQPRGGLFAQEYRLRLKPPLTLPQSRDSGSPLFKSSTPACAGLLHFRGLYPRRSAHRSAFGSKNMQQHFFSFESSQLQKINRTPRLTVPRFKNGWLLTVRKRWTPLST